MSAARRGEKKKALRGLDRGSQRTQVLRSLTWPRSLARLGEFLPFSLHAATAKLNSRFLRACVCERSGQRASSSFSLELGLERVQANLTFPPACRGLRQRSGSGELRRALAAAAAAASAQQQQLLQNPAARIALCRIYLCRLVGCCHCCRRWLRRRCELSAWRVRVRAAANISAVDR